MASSSSEVGHQAQSSSICNEILSELKRYINPTFGFWGGNYIDRVKPIVNKFQAKREWEPEEAAALLNELYKINTETEGTIHGVRIRLLKRLTNYRDDFKNVKDEDKLEFGFFYEKFRALATLFSDQLSNINDNQDSIIKMMGDFSALYELSYTIPFLPKTCRELTPKVRQGNPMVKNNNPVGIAYLFRQLQMVSLALLNLFFHAQDSIFQINLMIYMKLRKWFRRSILEH